MAQVIIWGVAQRGVLALGDIVEVLDDGESAGTATIDAGQPWSGTVRSDSDFIILDMPVSGGRVQANKDLISVATGSAVPDIETLNRFVRIQYENLPPAVQAQLIANRRLAITFLDWQQYVGLRDGVTQQDVIDHYNEWMNPTPPPTE